jgi:hypothetical protein
MKRLFLPVLLTFALWLACPFSTGTGAGSQAGALLNDPRIGLDHLDDYRATLKISFKGSQAGKLVDSTDTFVQTEWPAQAAKFTFIDTTGPNGVHQVLLAGTVGEAQYFQADSRAACTVSWGAAAGGSIEFRPASLLPPVGAARLAGEETIDGIATRHYTFEAASLGLPADVSAKGGAWIARDGGHVMKYVLDITGSDSIFGSGNQGTRHVEYLLSEIGGHPQVVYPAGCKPVLDLPAMDNATDLTRLPGLLVYSTNAPAETIFAFYTDKLTLQGWKKKSEANPGTVPVTVTYVLTDTGMNAMITVETEGSSRRVTVMAANPKTAAASTDVPGTTSSTPTSAAAGKPSVRVLTSLNILLGTVPGQPVLASYHLESTDQQPAWDGHKIAQIRQVMRADVQGRNVHFTYSQTKPGGTVSTSEVYIIDDQDYEVVNGQVQLPGPSMKALAWSAWPLDPTTILAAGSTGITAAGVEVLDGRTVEVYLLSGTSPAALPGTGIALPIDSASGKVWVDQQTGALLKAVLDYQAGVRDTAGNDKGSGSGHLEITVTQVGQVAVTLPK